MRRLTAEHWQIAGPWNFFTGSMTATPSMNDLPALQDCLGYAPRKAAEANSTDMLRTKDTMRQTSGFMVKKRSDYTSEMTARHFPCSPENHMS
jgi:hypothetical protein